MDLVVYGAAGPAGGERQLAYRLLEIALERECGLKQLPEIARAAGGKPCFPQYPHIHFNLSHSRGAAVCALSGAPVGVDVEVLRTPPRHLSAGLGTEEFFRLWTAKEATAKLLGLGVSALRTLAPDRRCQCLEGFLPGCIVTVCPASGPVRTVRMDPPFWAAAPDRLFYWGSGPD